MRGRIPPDEDAWLYRKWKTEVDVDSLLQATLPPGPVEDEVGSYEALVLAGRVSDLSNAATPEQDAVVPVLATPSNVAKLSDAGISEEEGTAIPVAPAWMATRQAPVDETKTLVVGDWLSDKGILAWLHDKLYYNEVEEPEAWTMAVTYIVSCLKIMRKYEDSKGTNHTTVGLAWRHRHIFIVTIAKGSIGFFVPSTAESQYGPSKSTFGSRFLVIPWSGQCQCQRQTPLVKGCCRTSSALGFQQDGWSCGYQSLHLCDEVAGHRGSLDDVDDTPLPKRFVKEALRIINADCSVQIPSTIPDNGWEGEVICWEPGESPPALLQP